jgi:hypothetical protein
MAIRADFLPEYIQSIRTHGMSRNASKLKLSSPSIHHMACELRAKQLARNLRQGDVEPLRELCKTIAIKRTHKNETYGGRERNKT